MLNTEIGVHIFFKKKHLGGALFRKGALNGRRVINRITTVTNFLTMCGRNPSVQPFKGKLLRRTFKSTIYHTVQACVAGVNPVPCLLRFPTDLPCQDFLIVM